MINFPKGSDLLSVRVMVFSGLFTALTTGGIAPLVALLSSVALMILLRHL